MEVIEITPKKLKNIIDNNKMIGKGYYGAVIEYGDQLIKVDIDLYKKLKDKNIYNVDYALCEHYKYEFDRDFQDRKQIEILASKQKDVKLTKLPKGIIILKSDSKEINGISPGIITYYHRNHKKLEDLNPHDYKRVLVILKKLLLAVKELEENKISQNDLVHYEDYEIEKRNTNVLYKDNTPEIIDMSGFFVRVGDDFSSAVNMYRELGNIIMDYFYLNHLNQPFTRDTVTTYTENSDMIKELEERTKRL